MGKHQEYEQKLLEQYMNSQNIANSQINCSKSIPIQKKTSSPITVNTPSETPPTPTQTDSPQSITPPTNSTPPNTSNKEAWPCLQQGKTENGRPNPKPDTSKPNHRLLTDPPENSSLQKPTDPPVSTAVPPFKPPPRLPLGVGLKPFENPATSLSLFSGNGFTRFVVGEHKVQVTVEATLEHPFFVFGQGWSSCEPERSLHRYGLDCQRLSVGDVCISLTHKDVQERAAEISLQQQELSKDSPLRRPLSEIPPPPSAPPTRGRRPVTSRGDPGSTTSRPCPVTMSILRKTM